MRLIRFFYNLFFPIVLLVLLPGFLFRMLKRGNYRHKFGQRFGIYSQRVLDKIGNHRWTWIHAVSVGEVLIAQKFIQALKEREPDLRVVLSTTTSTGYRLAHRQKSAWLEPVYNPLDFLWAASRAVKTFRPERLILVEAEVWPNITALAKKQGASLALINTRLSSRSERRYRKARLLVAPLFNQLDAICVQEAEDVTRWLSLGVQREKIHLTGSIKFDNAASTKPPRDFTPVLRDFGVPAETRIILGGSTFPGEESLLAQVRERLAAAGHHVFLILVPRHAERGADILTELTNQGFRAALRSANPSNDAPIDILIVNSTGELRDWYRCADIVFMGKSLSPEAKGGQNPAEPIEVGKPVLFGPNMQNFTALVRQLVGQGAAREVRDAEELATQFAHLLANPSESEKMVSAGLRCLESHRGATSRTCDIIQRL